MRNTKKILVGLKEVGHAGELMHLACRLPATKTAQITAIHVIELPEPTPLDAEVPEFEKIASAVLQVATKVARKHRRAIKTKILRAHSAVPALVDEIQQGKFDLAVIGYHHGRTLGELLLGSTSQYIARKASCEMLVHIPKRASGRA